jgi:hypothetical protein
MLVFVPSVQAICRRRREDSIFPPSLHTPILALKLAIVNSENKAKRPSLRKKGDGSIRMWQEWLKWLSATNRDALGTAIQENLARRRDRRQQQPLFA